jgi:hypothetical protein
MFSNLKLSSTASIVLNWCGSKSILLYWDYFWYAKSLKRFYCHDFSMMATFEFTTCPHKLKGLSAGFKDQTKIWYSQLKLIHTFLPLYYKSIILSSKYLLIKNSHWEMRHIWLRLCISHKVGENIFTTIKMWNNYWYPLKMVIFSIAPHLVIALPTLRYQKLSLLISFIPIFVWVF